MARITVEDCLQKVNNRFALIHSAAKRVRQLRKGAEPTLASKNKDIVVALREIAAGTVAVSHRSREGTRDLPTEEFLTRGLEEKTEENSAAEVD